MTQWSGTSATPCEEVLSFHLQTGRLRLKVSCQEWPGRDSNSVQYASKVPVLSAVSSPPQPLPSPEEAASGWGGGGPGWFLSGSIQHGRQAQCSDSRVQGEPRTREKPNHIQGHTSRESQLGCLHPMTGRGAPGHCPPAFSCNLTETAYFLWAHFKKGSLAEPAM